MSEKYEFVTKGDMDRAAMVAISRDDFSAISTVFDRLLAERDAFREVAVASCCPGVSNDMCEEDTEDAARCILVRKEKGS